MHLCAKFKAFLPLGTIRAICGCSTLDYVSQLTYPEFPFESEAKGDSLIGVHQTKKVKN